MNGNPFYIRTAQPNVAPVMQGIGALVSGVKKKNDQEAMQKAFGDAWQSDNPDAIARIASENPQYAQALIGMMEHKNDTTMQNRRGMLSRVAQNPESMVDELIAHKSIIEEQGGTSDITDEDILMAQENPETAYNEMVKDLAVYDPEGYKSLAPTLPGYVDPEFLKEERKYAQAEVKDFNKNAREMTENVKKMGDLREQAKGTGTSARAARISMIANIVRLNSPGIVSESELQTYTGGQSGVQAFLQFLDTKGVDTQAFRSYVDPAGDHFDADGVYKLGKTLAASKAGGLASQYEGALSRAEAARLSKRAMSANFGKNEYYDNVRALQKNVPDEALELLRKEMKTDPDAVREFEEYYGYLPSWVK